MNEYVAEHDRQLANLLRIGTVAALQAEPPRVQVSVGDMRTDWLPWFTHAAGSVRTWSAPSVGSQVMILSPSGDMAQGCVLPAIYQDAYAAPSSDPNVVNLTMPDGTVLSYDSGSHTLTADLGESSIKATKTAIEFKVGGCTMTLTAAGLAITGGTITQSGGSGGPAATFDGDMHTTGTMTADTDVIGGGKSLKTHTHNGVQTGGGNTGAPN